jgi:hypothetical protein
MPIGIKIIKLFKKLLSMAYKRKEKNILLAKIQKISSLQRVGKRQGLINLRELIVKP